MTRPTVRSLLQETAALIERDGFRRAGLGIGGWGLAAALEHAGAYDFPLQIRAAERIRKVIKQDSILEWELDLERTQDDVLTALRRAAR